MKPHTLIALSLFSVSVAAKAQEPSTVQPTKPAKQLYLSISPFHLASGIVELTGEYKLRDKVSIAGILGYGYSKQDGYGYFVRETGVQGIVYPIGDFHHGMQLGLEANFVDVKLSETPRSAPTDLRVQASGLAGGAFVGYKIETGLGLTASVQAGAQYFAAVATADKRNGDGSAVRESRSGLIPLLNINAGWSF